MIILEKLILFRHSSMKVSALNVNTVRYSIVLAVIGFWPIVKGSNLSITECQPNGQIPNDDNMVLSFTCLGALGNDTVQWVLRKNGSQKLSLLCPPRTQQCDNSSLPVIATRPRPSESVFKIERSYWANISYADIICSSRSNSSNFYSCSTSINRPSSPTVTTNGRTQGSSTTSSTTVGQQSGGSSTSSSTTAKIEREDDNNDLPVAAIAGGVAAAVAVILIIIIIVVVVVRKRRREQKATSNGPANNNDREEHVNPLYGSEDAPAHASPPNNKPSGVALMLPAQNNYGNTAPSQANGPATIEQPDDGIDVGYASVEFGDKQQAASPSAGQTFEGPSPQTAATSLDTATTFVTDADMYVAVDGPGQSTEVRAAAEEAGMGYSTVGSSSVMPSATAPSGDVYAVVQKPGTRAKSTTGGPADTAAEGAGNTYAVVKKSRSSDPAASSTGNTSPHDQSSDNADSTYAAVDKSRPKAPATSSAGNASSRGPTSNNAYAFVSKSSPGEHGGASFTTADTTAQTSSGDVYAQVDKSAKQKRQASDGDDKMQSPVSAPVYAQVNKQPKGDNITAAHSQEKPKPATKPKLAVKPKVTGFE